MATQEHLLHNTPFHDADVEATLEQLQQHPCYAMNTETISSVHHLLYTSHFLSTWNSRLFEFGAYLFLATLYPGTLLPASVYALTRAGSAALLSPWLGSCVDAGNRLKVVRLSIIGQRLSVALSCTILLAMARLSTLREHQIYSAGLLACLCLLAALEKLSSVVNTISIERDWVVVIAGDNEEHLQQLNAMMRRIDLCSKLVGPLAISFMDSISASIAILVTGIMTLLSVGIEYWAIARVYQAVPALRESKSTGLATSESPRLAKRIVETCQTSLTGSVAYFRHPACLPSFALALLYLTVLSFAGQMITYLLSLGVAPGTIGILRGVAAMFELSATWLGPKLMDRIGAVRAGIWFINWQILCVSVACLFFWIDAPTNIAITGTVAAVIASRVGLWGFDLCAQIIVQEEVEPELRGAFSSREFALQNAFEMLSFASTIVFARPALFRYPATISAVAVGVAGVSYAAFVRQRRGHLVHLSKCMDRHHRGKHGWSRVSQVDVEGGQDQGVELQGS